jgi:hypothetical protein
MKLQAPTLTTYVQPTSKFESNAIPWITESFQKLESAGIPYCRWFNVRQGFETKYMEI